MAHGWQPPLVCPQPSALASPRLLSRPPAPILVELGALVRYEVAVGMNGRVWVNASSPRAAAVVMAAIRAAETLSDDEVAAFAAKLAAQMGADDAAKP